MLFSHISDGKACSGHINITAGDVFMWLTGAYRLPGIGLGGKVEVYVDLLCTLPKVNTCSLELFLPSPLGRQPPELVEWFTEMIIDSQDFGNV